MSRAEIMKLLKEFRDNCGEQYGIISLGVFGSVARDQIQADSDVDVVVKLKKQDLFNMIGIKQDLEETLHVSVDIVSYRDHMNAFLKNRIDKESIYV